MMLPSLVLFFSQIFAIQCELIKDPTLKPADPFSASVDAGVFRKEIIEDAATNRDKLVKIWFHRTFEQRHQIEDEYNKKCTVYTNGYYSWWEQHCPFSTGLKDISDDTMCDLYVDSLLSPENLLGKTAHEAIMDKWKEKGAIEEIVCGNDKQMKDKINRFYQEAYRDSLENQLATFRKDDKDYQHVMQQCWKGLCQEKKIKPEDADKEAEALRAIDPDKDKDGFKKKLNELLDKNCEPDMKMIFEKYRKDKCNIVDSVEKAFGDCERVERAYNRFVRYIENTCQFYADELHNAMDGAGTDTDKINRIVLTRCERDLACIGNKYKEIHKKTFTNRLKTDTIETRWLESIRYLAGKP